MDVQAALTKGAALGQGAANMAQQDNEADLICEALVREIGRNTRWMAKVQAWDALLAVRRMDDAMQKERQFLSGNLSGAGVAGAQVQR